MGSWLSKSKLRAVIDKTKSRCGYCGVQVLPEKVTIDHMTPKSKGGTNNLDNLMICCRPCNTAKAAKTLEEFRTWIMWRDLAKDNGFSVKQICWILENTDLSVRRPQPKLVFYFENNEGGLYEP